MTEVFSRSNEGTNRSWQGGGEPAIIILCDPGSELRLYVKINGEIKKEGRRKEWEEKIQQKTNEHYLRNYMQHCCTCITLLGVMILLLAFEGRKHPGATGYLQQCHKRMIDPYQGMTPPYNTWYTTPGTRVPIQTYLFTYFTIQVKKKLNEICRKSSTMLVLVINCCYDSYEQKMQRKHEYEHGAQTI